MVTGSPGIARPLLSPWRRDHCPARWFCQHSRQQVSPSVSLGAGAADQVRDTGAEAVIPPRSNRKTPHAYDRALYRERNLVERFFNKLDQFRRVATRYDKLLANYMGFVQLAAIAIPLQ